jgi:4-amino-4-deoxy-L-arabinose transferase-like glycosyltransferase
VIADATRAVGSLLADDARLDFAARQPTTLQRFARTHVPEHSLREWGIALLVFVLSLFYLRIFYKYTVLNGDEGILLQGAQRILQGQVLYRDFFSLVTPGSYYWTAMLFKAFGSSILVARAALMVYGGVFSVLAYLLARRVCSRWSALLAAYLAALVCLPYTFVMLHNWDGVLLAYLALYFSVRFLERPCWAWSAAAGLLASLTCLCDQSIGIGLVLGLALGLSAVMLGGPHRTKFTSGQVCGALAAFAFPLVTTLAYFTAQHGLSQMLADCLWPLHHYSAVNKTSYGRIELTDSNRHALVVGPWPLRLFKLFVLSPCFLIPTLPILGIGFFGYYSTRLRKRKLAHQITDYYVLVSATMTGMLVSTVATGRPDLVHIIYQTPVFILVLAWCLDGSCVRTRLLNSTRPVLVLCICLSFTALGMALLLSPLGAHCTLHTRRGDLRGPRRDEVIEELQARVQAGQKVFVYPYEPLYYYLTATSNPTRYAFLMPGMNTAEQRSAAIHELAVDRTPVVVFQPSFTEKIPSIWPATPLRALAARDPVADYILAHYRPCKVLTSIHLWQFVFMVRKDLACTGRL